MVKILFESTRTNLQGKPLTCRIALILFTLIVLICTAGPLAISADPSAFYLDHLAKAPSSEFLLGTDPLGRDLLAVLLYGTRTSLLIGLLSALIISVIGISVGAFAALSHPLIDNFIMRLVELANSVPAILIVLLAGAFVQSSSLLSISLIVGLSSWFSLARMVRLEVKSISHAEYVQAAVMMGGGFFHILRRHLIPSILPPLLFVLISSISFAMGMEATLSFLGLGLPPDELSLGSLLSLANRAILLNAWWVILFPSAALMAILLTITALAVYFKDSDN